MRDGRTFLKLYRVSVVSLSLQFVHGLKLRLGWQLFSLENSRLNCLSQLALSEEAVLMRMCASNWMCLAITAAANSQQHMLRIFMTRLDMKTSGPIWWNYRTKMADNSNSPSRPLLKSSERTNDDAMAIPINCTMHSVNITLLYDSMINLITDLFYHYYCSCRSTRHQTYELMKPR